MMADQPALNSNYGRAVTITGAGNDGDPSDCGQGGSVSSLFLKHRKKRPHLHSTSHLQSTSARSLNPTFFV